MKFCTIGIFASANAGKTTVTENILHDSGVIESVGKVDSGNTITDDLKIERNRGITIRSSYVSFFYQDTVFQLLDTPGHVDFSAEVVRAVSVLDAAILVISGVEGIEAQTINIWNMLKSMNIPIIFFVNKLDRLGADYQAIVEELRNVFTEKLVSLQKIKCSKKIKINECSSEEIIEQMAEFDEVSMKKLFDGSIKDDNRWLDERIIELYKSRDIFCVMGGSALSEIGVRELMSKAAMFFPAFRKISNGGFCGDIYMIKCNERLKEVYIKVLSGTLYNRMMVNVNGEKQKVRTLKIVRGNKSSAIGAAEPGQLAIVTGLDCNAGDIIGDSKGYEIRKLSLSPMFTAVLSIDGDDEKIQLWNAMQQLGQEDPILNVRFNMDTKDIQIDLMGKLQGEIIVQMIQERFALFPKLSEPIIIYKETIVKEAIGKAAYTGTSNVALKIIPGKRGSGFVYKSLLASDYLYTKYQRQVERLVRNYVQYGLYGWELTDLEVYLIGGNCDSVGSEPKDYNIATPIALSRAVRKSGTKLLEPIVSYTVLIPEEYYDDILSRLMAMRKRYDEIFETSRESFIISGKAFLSEMIDFVDDLGVITSGRGIANYVHCGYDYALINKPVNSPMQCSNPHNEAEFILIMNGTMDSLDIGLESKRGKPERIKRNRHLWK